MKHLLKLTVILFLMGNFLAQGQFRAPGGLPPGFHHALLDTLSAGPPFYGRLQIQLTNGTGKDPTTISGNVAVLYGCMRLEVDSFDTGSNMPASQAANLKDMHSVTILRPDTNRMYMVYPDYKSYVEVAYGKKDGMDASPPTKITKVPLGKEPVGDQMCDKAHWNMTEGNGEQYDVTVWMATNVSAIPIQVKVGPPAAIVSFLEVHTDAPDSSLFVPPAGYFKYEGIQSIIQSEAEKAKNANSQ